MQSQFMLHAAPLLAALLNLTHPLRSPASTFLARPATRTGVVHPGPARYAHASWSVLFQIITHRRAREEVDVDVTM
jgi:hypothetical protein